MSCHVMWPSVMSGDKTEPLQFLPLDGNKQRLQGTLQTGDYIADDVFSLLLLVINQEESPVALRFKLLRTCCIRKVRSRRRTT